MSEAALRKPPSWRAMVTARDWRAGLTGAAEGSQWEEPGGRGSSESGGWMDAT